MPEAEPPASRPDAEAVPYAEHALREATEAGLTPAELRELLRGASVTTIVPPWPGESLADYADRATSELLIRYLTAGAPPDEAGIGCA